MPEIDDYNAKMIKEFRENGGMEHMLLLHHKGAKSGIERVNPLAYQQVGNDYAIFASKAGAPHDPHWFLNLKKNPEASIELGSETIKVLAREANGEERTRIFAKQKELMPGFAEYEEKVKGIRDIPVIVLEPR